MKDIFKVFSLWFLFTLCAAGQQTAWRGNVVGIGNLSVIGSISATGDVSSNGSVTAARSISGDSLTATSILRILSCANAPKILVKDTLRVVGTFVLAVKAFANLGTPANNTMYFCPDANSGTSPATSGGSG